VNGNKYSKIVIDSYKTNNKTATKIYNVHSGTRMNVISHSITQGHIGMLLQQGAYKFGKMKFPEFSKFSRPLKQSFPYNYNVKNRCNEPPYLTIGTFLALMQNYRIYF